MLRFIILFFIIITSLDALSSSEVLKRADGYMKSETKSNKFRAYNDYKNVYLRAVIDEDSRLQLRSLQGIVKSGSELHIDVSDYSKKLSHLKQDIKHKAKHKKNIQVTSSHKLESVKWEGSRLILTFDNKLRTNQVNYFKLYDSKKKRYKYIFDIHASMLTKSQNLRKHGISRVKIAQYNPSTLRLVFENNEKIGIRFAKKYNKLVIKTDVDTKKSTPVKKTVKHKDVPSKSKYIQAKKIDKNKVIVIDAGHGGKDPGAIGYKRYREKIIVMQISKELEKLLKARGYKVYMTRSNDKFIKLSNRTKFANKKNADLFISIHANAVGLKSSLKVHGIECYFLSPSRSKKASRVAEKENLADISEMNKYGKESFLNFLSSHKIIASNKLAIDLQRGMLGSLNKKYKDVHDGGVREGPFWVLVGAQMPAVLVEVGFISNPTEAKRLVNKTYQKTMAIGMADGIERYFVNNQ